MCSALHDSRPLYLPLIVIHFRTGRGGRSRRSRAIAVCRVAAASSSELRFLSFQFSQAVGNYSAQNLSLLRWIIQPVCGPDAMKPPTKAFKGLVTATVARLGSQGKMADDDLVCPPPVSACDHPARRLALCAFHA